MADHKDSEQFVGTAHDYIVHEYKDKWAEDDMGLFERTYRNNLAGLQVDPSARREELIRNNQDLLDLYCEIHHSPELNRDLASDPEVQDWAMKQAIAENESTIADTAAFNALDYISIYSNIPSDDEVEIKKEATDASLRKRNEDVNNQIISALEKMAAVTGLEYLVRGAPLQCSHGTHIRHLDMLESHGLYLKDKPLLHKKDCEVNKNIYSFGICNSPFFVSGETITLQLGAPVDQKGEYLVEKSEDIISGFRCEPKIPDGEWKNYKADTFIAQNAVTGIKSKNECDCYEAITSASYLICENKGIIFPLSSGQLEDTTYRPAFMSYPFADFGSDAFKEWCDKEDICPYYPGDSKYVGWYQDKINAVDKKDKKKAKKLYGQCIDGAYQMGLDNMSNEEQDKIHNMVNRYADSGLLKSKEIDEMKQKYSGLRVNYGSNDQVSNLKWNPDDDEFYDYYKKKAASYLDAVPKEPQIRDPSNATRMPDGYTSNDRNKEYAHFQKIIEPYDGYLSDEQKKEIQEIKKLFETPM